MRNRGPTTVYGIAGAIALAAVLIGLLVLLNDDGDSDVAREDPAGSVESFLIAAAGGDGDAACGYLSIPETRHVERAAGPQVPCSDAFLGSQLDLAGRDYLNDLRRVHFSTRRQGDHAVVDVTKGRDSVRFTLEPVSVAAIEQQPYRAPSSNWRITSGATTVVRPVP
jgi:hypothetical protein